MAHDFRSIVWMNVWLLDICLYIQMLFLELHETSPVAAVTAATSSLGTNVTSRPFLTLAADTKPTSSLSSSLVSPSLKLGDDGHATHLVPRLAPPSTLSMCMSLPCSRLSQGYQHNRSKTEMPNRTQTN